MGQQKHSVHMQSTANSHSNGHSNDLDLRRPATSGKGFMGLIVYIRIILWVLLSYSM